MIQILFLYIRGSESGVHTIRGW
uniref:Uncharacterized protein n=1 Tax=Arundo donax TaxID=35708 RepID=A0A0A8ZJR7_ARUDO